MSDDTNPTHSTTHEACRARLYAIWRTIADHEETIRELQWAIEDLAQEAAKLEGVVGIG